MTNNANFWTDWYTNCSQLSHDLRSHLRSRKMRLMRKIVGAIYMKYVFKLNLFNLVLIGIPFHPRKCPLLQNHVIICLEMSTISRKFRHTSKHDDVVDIKSMFRKCLDCRPWENKPVINRPGMSPGQTPLIPPSERLMLNRLDQHLERGKEGEPKNNSHWARQQVSPDSPNTKVFKQINKSTT